MQRARLRGSSIPIIQQSNVRKTHSGRLVWWRCSLGFCGIRMGKTAPEPKRRKINQLSSRGTVSSSTAQETRDATSKSHMRVTAAQTGEINARIQQAKNFAVAQAQQEGCTSNFKIFDSPFGNFLVPVVPTRKELAG